MKQLNLWKHNTATLWKPFGLNKESGRNEKETYDFADECCYGFGYQCQCVCAPVGVVNVNAVLNSYPGITEIAKSVAQEKTRLQEEFNKQSANMSDAEKQALAEKLSKQLADFEQKKMAPVQRKINKTILDVAKANNIDSVVNMNAMVAGGKDLTDEVIKALK